MKNITIFGASGFVGSSLCKYLEKTNNVIKVSRNMLNDEQKLDSIIQKSDVVINLIGAPIISRWTDTYKKELLNSRVDNTKKIVQSMNKANKKIHFLSTSAIGIYKEDQSYTEGTNDYANTYLAQICKSWEDEALKTNENVTTSIMRFSVVLGKNGGALQKMWLPFSLGLGGIIGDGKQSMSFIHIKDLCKIYKYVIENNLGGIFNVSAPEMITNEQFTKTLGKILNRPTIFPVPVGILKIIFGEGSQVLTNGQAAVPQRLINSSFKFDYPTIEETLKDIKNS